MSEDLNKIAQQFFIAGDFFNAKKLYQKLHFPLETAYCELFSGNLNEAKNIIASARKDSPAHEWLVSFIQMIEADLQKMPTYLQIRNFYEIDLNNLFLSGEKLWIENVINHVPILASINPEIFKLTARVLKNNEQENLAKKFLKKSLDIYFYDSETHYMLAQIYLKEDIPDLAKQHLLYACEQGSYLPAEKLLQKIEY